MLAVRVKKRQGAFVVDLAFETPGHGITSLFGPSGAGKTTVIDMIAGLVRPDEGRIELNGLTLFDSQAKIDLPPEKRRVGYVFQDGRLFPHLSVRSNLTFGMRRTRPADRYVPFDQVVDLLGIGHLLGRRPTRLSGGEKQRVAIGRALLTSPRLILMDEPMASLDDARKAEVLPFVGKLRREFSVPIIYVTHNIREIRDLADSVVLVDSGRALEVGEAETVLGRLPRHSVETSAGG